MKFTSTPRDLIVRYIAQAQDRLAVAVASGDEDNAAIQRGVIERGERTLESLSGADRFRS